MTSKYFVYMLLCSDGTLYTGITNDLENRIKVHKSGKGSKYVRARMPFELVYTEELESKSHALKREIEIKKMDRNSKIELLAKGHRL